MSPSGQASPRLFEATPDASLAPLSTSPGYERHRPEATVLYQVVQDNLEMVLLEACAASEHGFGLPRHVEQTFRDYISCGRIEIGFRRDGTEDRKDGFGSMSKPRAGEVPRLWV
jgi:hypothetical protein